MKTEPLAACRCCNTNAVKVRTPGLSKGRYGWTRAVGESLEFSPRTYPDLTAALAAAHEHYGRPQ